MNLQELMKRTSGSFVEGEADGDNGVAHGRVVPTVDGVVQASTEGIGAGSGSGDGVVQAS